MKKSLNKFGSFKKSSYLCIVKERDKRLSYYQPPKKITTMSQLVASSKNLTARVKNVIKMLSKLDENQFRHFICVMNTDWLAEMANILGTDQEAENLYNAVRNSATTYETESELESEAA